VTASENTDPHALDLRSECALQQPKAQSDFLKHTEAAGWLGLGKQALLQGATKRDVTF